MSLGDSSVLLKKENHFNAFLHIAGIVQFLTAAPLLWLPDLPLLYLPDLVMYIKG